MVFVVVVVLVVVVLPLTVTSLLLEDFEVFEVSVTFRGTISFRALVKSTKADVISTVTLTSGAYVVS